jgi:nucleotide-binding universal stress UspA family protein
MCQRESRSPIQLLLLHVELPLSSYVASKLPAGAAKRYHDDHSRDVLERAAAAFARENIACKTHAVVGDPVKCIVEFARDAGMHRVALVTRARQTIPEVLFGSIATGVLQQSPVPVEVVPIEPGSPLRVYARAAGAGATILTLVYLALE